MRARLGVIVAIFIGLSSLGAVPVFASGFMGGDAPSRIPVPARVFSASFEDVGGVAVTGTRVTFDGEVFVHGRLGAAQITVPFERVSEVRFESASDKGRRTAVVYVTGEEEPVRIDIKDDTPWFARARFGNYKIESRDLRVVSGFKLQE